MSMQCPGHPTLLTAASLLAILLILPSPGFAEERYRAYRGEQEPKAAAKAGHVAPVVVKTAAPVAKADPHGASDSHGGHAPAVQMQPAHALNKLLDGNARYVSGKTQGPNRSASRRSAVSKGQNPFAIIISCSDSRVPPEILFDQGIGDLFVIRTAGNIVDDVAIGSIEYAVEHLGTNLIMVLGHQTCGAVSATVAGGTPPGHVGSIVNMIAPAVEKARAKSGDLVDNSVRANVKLVSEKLRGSEPILRELMDDGTVRIVGGYYDMESGSVSMTYQPCM